MAPKVVRLRAERQPTWPWAKVDAVSGCGNAPREAAGRALLAAFGEAGNQAGNRAYDQYIVELYRFLAAEASNFP